MLQTVSWSQYLLTITLLTAVYYVGLAAACYRVEISQLINRLQQRSLQAKANISPQVPQDISHIALENFATAVDRLLTQAGREAGKPVLLSQLRHILKAFEAGVGPAQKYAAINHIISQSAAICDIHITEAELEK